MQFNKKKNEQIRVKRDKIITVLLIILCEFDLLVL